MARSCRLLIGLAFWGVTSLSFGETPATPVATPASKKAENAWKKALKRNYEVTPSPEFENVRQALNALKPAQRKRFEENFVRWANLAPDEKTALLDREQLRKKIMQKEVEAAIHESGLPLEGARREEFARRYAEERRKIEEQLRKESTEKRKPLVHDLIGRLQAEFSAAGVAAPAPSPAP